MVPRVLRSRSRAVTTGTESPLRAGWGAYVFRTKWVPYVLWVVFSAAYATLSLRRFARFQTPSWDNAIFEQAVRAYASLSAPIVNIKGPGFNLLGDHFSPIIALLAPVYRVVPHPQTLLVAQALLVGLSVVPVTRLAMRRIGTAAGLATGAAYALSFGIASAIAADFHEVAFGAPLLAFAGEAFVEQRWRAVVLWSVPLLLVKEDLGITVAAVGAAVALRGARRTGLGLMFAGVLGFVLVLFVVVPAFNPAGTYDYLGIIGGGDGQGTVESFLQGWDTKAYTLALTFGVTGFVALGSPWTLLTLPTLAWRFVGDNPYYWSTDWHYSLLLMPVVFVGMVDAILRAREHRWEWVRSYAGHVPAVAAAVAIVVSTQYPLADLARPETYQPSPRAEAAHTVLDRIPQGASVETDIGLITHLTSDREVYWTGTVGSVVPEYVLIDSRAGWNTVPDVDAYAERRHRGAEYELIFDRGGYLLAHRVG